MLYFFVHGCKATQFNFPKKRSGFIVIKQTTKVFAKFF